MSDANQDRDPLSLGEFPQSPLGVDTRADENAAEAVAGLWNSTGAQPNTQARGDTVWSGQSSPLRQFGSEGQIDFLDNVVDQGAARDNGALKDTADGLTRVGDFSFLPSANRGGMAMDTNVQDEQEGTTTLGDVGLLEHVGSSASGAAEPSGPLEGTGTGNTENAYSGANNSRRVARQDNEAVQRRAAPGPGGGLCSSCGSMLKTPDDVEHPEYIVGDDCDSLIFVHDVPNAEQCAAMSQAWSKVYPKLSFDVSSSRATSVVSTISIATQHPMNTTHWMGVSAKGKAKVTGRTHVIRLSVLTTKNAMTEEVGALFITVDKMPTFARIPGKKSVFVYLCGPVGLYHLETSSSLTIGALPPLEEVPRETAGSFAELLSRYRCRFLEKCEGHGLSLQDEHIDLGWFLHEFVDCVYYIDCALVGKLRKSGEPLDGDLSRREEAQMGLLDLRLHHAALAISLDCRKHAEKKSRICIRKPDFGKRSLDTRDSVCKRAMDRRKQSYVTEIVRRVSEEDKAALLSASKLRKMFNNTDCSKKPPHVRNSLTSNCSKVRGYLKTALNRALTEGSNSSIPALMTQRPPSRESHGSTQEITPKGASGTQGLGTSEIRREKSRQLAANKHANDKAEEKQSGDQLVRVVMRGHRLRLSTLQKGSCIGSPGQA